MNLHEYDLAALAEGLAQGQFSATELAAHFRARIDQFDPQLNSIITRAETSPTAAVAPAPGPLHGIPLLHKDVFCTRDLRTTAASKMLGDWIPPYSATVVERLSAAGMSTLGKTNMDEFAMGSSNETSHFGAARNPWDLERVPGGSSGGSAAAVAAGLVPVATGTDTGGSVRQPAAFCGITGIKPTYGRCSRYGMIAFASSLDQAGVFARSARDCALVLQAMAGHDPRDSTSADVAVPAYAQTLDQPLQGLRIGKPREFFAAGLDAETGARIEAALAVYTKLGATIVDISLPRVELCVPVYYVLAPAEAASNLSRYDGVRFGYRCAQPKDLEDLYTRSRSEGFGREVQRRITIGTYVLSQGYYDAYYLQAQKVRRLLAEDFAAAFAGVDLIAGPTTPGPAYRLGEKTDDPVAMYLDDIYTTPANLAGLPALSVPAGLVRGLPVGLQLIGPAFSEGRLLNAAHQFQQQTDHHQQRPAAFFGGEQ